MVVATPNRAKATVRPESGSEVHELQVSCTRQRTRRFALPKPVRSELSLTLLSERAERICPARMGQAVAARAEFPSRRRSGQIHALGMCAGITKVPADCFRGGAGAARIESVVFTLRYTDYLSISSAW